MILQLDNILMGQRQLPPVLTTQLPNTLMAPFVALLPQQLLRPQPVALARLHLEEHLHIILTLANDCT